MEQKQYGRSLIYKLILLLITTTLMVEFCASVFVSVQATEISNELSTLELFFSHESGWYKDAFDLELVCNYYDAMIYYTTDGSEPDPVNNSRATIQYDAEEKVRIYNKFNFANNYSDMNFAWGAPYVKATEYQPKSTTVKAFAVRVNAEMGEEIERTKTITKTYFVDKELANKYGVKVVSITGEPGDFFGSQYGNGNASGSEYGGVGFLRNSSQNPDNVDAHVQMFDETGKQIIDQDINIKLHGAYSRSFNQKTFRLCADKDFDANHNKFDYPFFNQQRDINGKVIKKYKRILTRNAGNDCNNAMLRDAFTSRLVSKMGFGVLASEPAVVYLFDEFYGLCHLRERYDDHYISDHYNIEREDAVVITTHSFELNEGRPEIDDRDWLNLVSFVNNSDMGDSENYNEFEMKVDVDSYISYCIAQLYIANTDWTNNNTRIWRSACVYTDEDEDTYGTNGVNYNDGRWRYLWYDTDISSGVFHPHNNFGGQPTNFNFDSIEYLNMVSAGSTGFDLLHLLESRKFRKKFVDIYVNHINTTFKSERVNSVLDEVAEPMRKSMPYEIDRFGMIKDMDTWENNLKNIKSFFKSRGDAVMKQLDKRWEMGDAYTLTLDRVSENPDDFLVSDVKLEPVMLDEDGKWRGEYYSANTIDIECNLSNGENFAAWEITDSKGTRTVESKKVQLNLSSDTMVKVIYKSDLATPTPESTPTPALEIVPTVEPTSESTVESTTTPTLELVPGFSATACATNSVTDLATVLPTQTPDAEKFLVIYYNRIDTFGKDSLFARPNDVSKKGYTFVGWYRDEKFTEKAVFPIAIEENTILYARFEKNPTAVKRKSIKVKKAFDKSGKILYIISWKPVKKGSKSEHKKVKYRVEASHNKKGKRFKALTKYMKKTRAVITTKMLKNAKFNKKLNKKKKIYIRISSGKKVAGVWCVSCSKKISFKT